MLAQHPQTGMLHTGSVLTSGHDSFHVLFDRIELGVRVVRDQEILLISDDHETPGSEESVLLNQYIEYYLKNKFGDGASQEGQTSQFVPYDSTTFTESNKQSISLLIFLFKRKLKMIQMLKSISDEAETERE